jgi:TonB family protein
MKQCPTCQEEFADKFGFCPVDGTPLSAAAIPQPVVTAQVPDESVVTASAPANGGEPASSNGHSYDEEATVSAHPAQDRGEYHLTFIQDDGLVHRLTREVKAVAHDAELTWPEFKRDPVGFTRRSATAYGNAGWKFFSQRNVAIATLAAFVFVGGFIGVVFAGENRCAILHRLGFAPHVCLGDDENPYANLELVQMLDPENNIPEEQKKPDKGPAGTETGKGGGSKKEFERPHGGGGGGRDEELPASTGKLPTAQLVPPILTANPKPPAIANPHLPTPVTIDVDPMLIKPDTRDIAYGDPKSTATTPSSGPGHGGGMGNGTGGGVGPGEGGGYGPGRGGNIGGGDREEGGGGRGGGGGGDVDYSRPFQPREVTRKALITFKPEPSFTEDARKNNVTGLVRLKAVLSSSGSVTGISVIKGLPDGLTEKAIAAAKQIRFTPAEKDGHTVSQYVTLEYNFNIY